MRKRWRMAFGSVLLCTALASGCVLSAAAGETEESEKGGHRTEKTELTVFAAASMTETLTKLAETYEQKHPEKNELFRLIIEHLCSGDGSLYLPDRKKSLDALFRLAQYAGMSQAVFEGRSTLSENGDVPVLNEAVVSVRSLIHILDTWNYGEEMDLSMALWKGFLSSVTNQDDRNLLLALAGRYGFFTENEGWKVETRGRGEPGQTYEDIRLLPYEYEVMPLETLSREEVVYLLFGNGPERKQLPDCLKEIAEVDTDQMKVTTILDQDAALRNLEHSAALLDTLHDQE